MNNSQYIDVDFSEILKNKFKMFKQISSLFNKKDKEVITLQKQVDDIILKKDYILLSKLLDNNYKLTKKQEEQISINLIKIIYSDDKEIKSNAQMNNILMNGVVKLPERVYSLIYLNSNIRKEIKNYLDFETIEDFLNNAADTVTKKGFFFKKEKQNYQFEFISHIFCAINNKNSFIKVWAENFYQHCEEGESFFKDREIIQPFQMFKEYLFAHASIKQLDDLLSLLKHKEISSSWDIEEMVEEIKEVKRDKIISSNINPTEIIETTKKLFNKTENIENEIDLNTLELSKNNLPETSKKILINIEKAHHKIITSKKYLSFEQETLATRLVEKRIPEFIELYLSIHNKDKKDITTNKTPIEFLNESLENILTSLNEVVNDIDEAKISSLKANTAYTSSYHK